jgi:hypothetical protein
VPDEVLAQLLLEQAARRELQHALLVAAVDRLLEARVRALAAGVLRGVQADGGMDVDRGVEQHEPFDAIRARGRGLERHARAEGVAEPGAATRWRALERIRDVLLEVPGRLPRGVGVAAQVERDDVRAVLEPQRQALEVARVARDAVEADERGQGGITPLP